MDEAVPEVRGMFIMAQHEATTAAGVGPLMIPLGAVQRRVFPTKLRKDEKKKPKAVSIAARILRLKGSSN